MIPIWENGPIIEELYMEYLGGVSDDCCIEPSCFWLQSTVTERYVSE